MTGIYVISRANPFLQGVAMCTGKLRASTAFSPSDVDGLSGWWDASDSTDATKVTLNAGKIETLIDQSSTGADMTQVTAGERPDPIVSSQNGLDVARFVRASAESLQTGAVAAWNSWSSCWIFAAYKYTGVVNAASEWMFVMSNSSNSLVGNWTYSLSTNDHNAYGGVATAGNTIKVKLTADNVFDQYTTRYHNSGKGRARLNGTETGTAAGTITPGSNVGCSIAASAAEATHGDIDMGEMIMYLNTAMTDVDRNLIETYLKDKWGTA